MKPVFGMLFIANGVIIGILGVFCSLFLPCYLGLKWLISPFILVPSAIISVQVFVVIAVFLVRHGFYKFLDGD